ncbi:hypothetical protein [Sphingomonas sp. PAMC 26605]|uniref:hypothetical protein n=1 Tax=Sphingomonas sp. PAMC 26605 TaxID=1112214 RepID=UPI00026CD1E4|nr:hypothetical protein [Sphingomonas sp. PAMC 26605]
MQDRYIGDAGDYAKFSLLNSLTSGGESLIPLGVLWYRFPDETHNGDGRHISYLGQPEIALRSPEVHAMLADLVASGRRTIAAAQGRGILPANTLFFSALVLKKGTPAERASYRAAWFKRGLRNLAEADLIFFDPDNGIETPALDRRGLKAGKYVFWSEIEQAWDAGKSLVIYNHLNRSAPAWEQTARLATQFSTKLGGTKTLIPLLFRRGSCRHIWVVAQERHSARLEARAMEFLSRGWALDTDIQIIKTSGAD